MSPEGYPYLESWVRISFLPLTLSYISLLPPTPLHLPIFYYIKYTSCARENALEDIRDEGEGLGPSESEHREVRDDLARVCGEENGERKGGSRVGCRPLLRILLLGFFFLSTDVNLVFHWASLLCFVL